MKTIPQKAAAWAKRICKDQTHGYDNTPGHRTGNPDYACSSFVAACYRKAGIDVPANAYTQTMKREFKPFGFQDVSDKVDLHTGKGMRVGDIVIAPGKHTEIVVNRQHRLAGARGNPRTGPTNGKPGDQTGREISVRDYYDDGWTICLRYAGSDPAVVT